MCHQHDGRAFTVYLQEGIHNFRCGSLIKCSCRLIGENDLRLHYHAAAYAGSLEFAAGYVLNVSVGKFRYVQLVHERSCSFVIYLTVFLIGMNSRKGNIINDIQIREHVHHLKYKAHLLKSEVRFLILIQSRDLSHPEPHLTGRCLVHS